MPLEPPSPSFSAASLVDWSSKYALRPVHYLLLQLVACWMAYMVVAPELIFGEPLPSWASHRLGSAVPNSCHNVLIEHPG